MRKGLASLLSGALVLSSLALSPATIFAAEEEKIDFPIAGADSIYAGMPLFDGEPDHMEDYIDTLFDYVGLYGACRWAFDTRFNHVLPEGHPHAGATIPGTLLFTDVVQGVSTDFPAMVGLGQTWNKDLMYDVGTVMGNERANQIDRNGELNANTFNVMSCTALQDMRINPLSGRFDEGYGEDPYHTSVMLDATAKGVSGIDLPESDDGFWIKAAVITKHFTTYNAQWFRTQNSNDAGVRTLMEYQIQGGMRGFESGSVSGFMSSYGRTNGVPNIISPLINYIQDRSKYGLFGVTDAGSVNHVSEANAYGNGYLDRYVQTREDIGALMAMATSSGASNSGNNVSDDLRFQQLVKQVEAGSYGVTAEDVFRSARAEIIPLIRTGFFNANAEDYPWFELSKGQTDEPVDYHNPVHQQMALESAQEGVALLKNDNNILPLSKDAKVAVAGFMGGARFKTTYAVKNSPQLENSGLAPIGGIQAVAGKDNVSYKSDGNIVVFKSVETGKYLVASQDENGDFIYATADNANNASQFEAYSWGQPNGYSYKSLDNDKWLKLNTTGGGWGGGGTPTGVKNNGTESLVVTDNELTATSYSSTMPSRFNVEDNGDGTVSILADYFSESFFSSFDQYFKSRYLTVEEDGKLNVTDQLKNKENAESLLTSSEKFVVETVKKAGTDTILSKTFNDSDYAVVVVGAATRHSAGEGVDRSDLYMGQDQYELVENVAKAYPGKTVVIVESSFPVIMEEIQNNPNVAAILYQPYGGQYGSYAMGQVLYGDYAPTGRLSSTWYASMDALPEIDDYSIGEGKNNVAILGETVDPRYTKDMSNADPMETKLTYMYTDADVTYEFGYGLSYSDFAYSNLKIGAAKEDGTFDVTVDVKNTGAVDTDEVVQLYVSNPNSAYGGAAPIKKLASFAKVAIKAGETATVSLNVNPQDFALWDVNAEEFIVEDGAYTIMVGRSSKDIKLSSEADIKGGEISILDASTAPVNVFDKSFASSDLTYREVSRQHTADALGDQEVSGGYYAVMSKWAGSWTGMKNVSFGNNATSMTFRVASNGDENPSFDVKLDAPDGETIASVTFDQTSPVEYDIKETGENPDAYADQHVIELGYTEVTVPIEGVTGVHDVYLVFNAAEVRVDTMQVEKTYPDTNTLEKFIAYAEDLIADGQLDGCISSVVDAFYAALTNAKAVAADKDASEDDVMKASAQLLKMIGMINYKVGNKAALELAVELAEGIDLSLYIQAGQKEFKDALTAAKNVLASDDVLQPTIDEAWEALTDAMLALRIKVDTSILKQLIEQAETMDLSVYTEASVTVLNRALTAGRTILAIADEATQDQVDAAANELKQAIASLERKGDSSSDPDDQKGDDGKGDSQSGGQTGGKDDSKPNTNTGDNSVLPIAVFGVAALGLLVSNKKRRSSI